MADSASEMESDTSSIDGGPPNKVTSPGQIEQLHKRIESLQQENRVLKMELETYKLRCKTMQEENKELRRASVNIQARAEQEEEFISNTLLKKIQALKKEKETLAMNYEQEEEFLTNDLSRKLLQLRREKVELEQTLEKEQEYQVNRLMQRITRLEAETQSKQNTLDQLRREKVELENALEQEQEALVNRLWKRMEKLEAEKRMLQEKLDQPVSSPPSPRDMNNGDTAGHLADHIGQLRGEVQLLKNQLLAAQLEHKERIAHYAQEERQVREENLRLQRKLQLEIERSENLCRHLSESESSLEMDDERHFNEMTKQQSREVLMMPQPAATAAAAIASTSHRERPRTVSSPIPVGSPGSSRPLSPGMVYGSPAGGAFGINSPPSPMKQYASSLPFTSPSTFLPGTSPQGFSHLVQKPRPSPDKFVRPAAPGPANPDRVNFSATQSSPDKPTTS